MSLADYQKQIDDSVQPYAKPYWDPLSQLAGIAEEVGEVARILNHQYGDKPKKPTEAHNELADELGDIIYSVMCLANSEGIHDLGPSLQKSIDKLITRDKDRFEKKKAE
jgi:NTP pyrophosphatase (non-canonical NTP hydrolase)